MQNKKRIFSLFISLTWSLFAFAQTFQTHPFLDSTIASWHRFFVEETGVQKITADFLKQLGIPIQDIDPRTLRIFGRGGQMLPLQLANEVETLYENHILVVGEQDGSFDKDDYILFMGYAGDTWNAESQTFTNLYHHSAQYYITYGTSFGKRVLLLEGQVEVSNDAIHSGIYQTAIEENKYNLGALGRRWFGILFSDEQKESFTFSTPNVADDEQINVIARVAASSNKMTSFSLQLENRSSVQSIGKKGETSVGAEPYSQFNSISGSLSLQANAKPEITAELSYSSGGDFGSNGYLDYIFVQYKRLLLGSGESFLFTLSPTESLQNLVVKEAKPETTLWELGNDVVYSTPNDTTTFGAEVLVDSQSKCYLATTYKTPIYKRSTKTLSPSSIWKKLDDAPALDYLLITTEEFREQGNRLIEQRQKALGLQAQLITLQEVYEAFSTGQQDIAAIRNLVRYLYFSQGKKLKYLCLFGDTSYDYQNRLASNNSVVPTFHALNSFSLTNSFMSDDFYTMMDAGEGLMTSRDQMDLAVGRMVFSDKAQANAVVDKVIDYENPKNIGSWSNSFTLLSDDVDLEWEYVIQERLDMVGDELLRNKPFLNITKLHSDAFLQVASAGGDRYPDVETAIENRLAQGTLVVNYFGHGGEDGLSKEFLIDKDMASTLFHPGKYPLFITSTCEFSRFDNPDRITAGELIYQNPVGGAIGLISTTRQIYVTNGINYNDIISKHLFSFGIEEYPTIAEAVRRAKREFTDSNQKRIIFFIGDPALSLHIPKKEVNVTAMNGIALENLPQEERQLKALDKVSLSGDILDENGTILTSFQGTVTLQVFDKKVIRTTLGNDGHKKLTFSELGQQIFQGQASVKNGRFSSTFVVPKDISLDIGEARISLIAFSEDKSSLVGGYSNQLSIGGINTLAKNDNQGPAVQVFLNDRAFVSGDQVFDSPTLLIDLFDENGINTAGGIGHDITAVLDDNQTNPYLLNPFYTTTIDDFTKGSVRYPLHDLDTGVHTLTVKAWDTFNNPTTTSITFWVMDNNSIQIEKIYNSPNPVTDQTTFFIQHNRPQELLQANLYIFTMDGKRIWSTTQDVFSTGYLLDNLHWDATSYNGQKVNKGIYLYTIELISTLSQSTDIHSGKLMIN